MGTRLDELGLPAEYSLLRENIPSELKGSEIITIGYEWYKTNYDTSAASQRAKNGRIFEALVLEALLQAGIQPVYYQANVEFIPHVVYDILLYHPKHPVILSCKTSLRERWKQADLEGLALKQVYRGASSYLLTLSKSEGLRVQQQIQNSEVLGMDECIIIDNEEDQFNLLIQKLQNTQFVKASKILPVNGKMISAFS